MPPPPPRERRLSSESKQPHIELKPATDDDDEMDESRTGKRKKPHDSGVANGDVNKNDSESQTERSSTHKNDFASSSTTAVDDASASDGPLVILASNLGSRQRLELRAMVDLLEGEMVEEWSERVTHIVMADERDRDDCATPSNPRINVPRTVKYLSGALCGQWIVEIAWARACRKAGHRVPEEPFEVAGDLVHPGCEGPVSFV